MMSEELNRTIFALFCLGVFLFSCNSYKQSDFSKKDVKKAQKVIGLDLGKNEIDTMYRYLGRNADGYDFLRTYTLGNDVFPALLFDPHPNEFILPKVQKEIKWSLPTNVDLPANEDDIAFYSISQLAALSLPSF